MLEALRADEMDVVLCCSPDSPRAVPAEETARAARALGCDDVSYADSVEDACDAALERAEADDLVLVTGSLYVAGAARPHLQAVLP
jgi:folylpolyglutamate synthase/dihydropteroate synthase